MRRPQGSPAGTPVVVIGLDSLQGIQTARIFRRRGVDVVALAADARHPACRTNVCEEIRIAPTDGQPLVDELLFLAAAGYAGAVLVPCQDKSVRTIARASSVLSPHFEFVLPEADIVDLLMDKVSFLEHAERNGIPVPKSFVLRSREDARRAAEALDYPCLLKPSFRGAEWDRNTKLKVFQIGSADELLSRYETCREWAEALIAQQRVEGDDSSLYSCNAYFAAANGEPLATFVARKLRQWPPGAGTSCLGEEVRNDVVLATTLELFDSVPYRGLAYLEMKQDVRTGEHFAIEPNVGRPTGRSAIAEAGGVELLWTMYCDTLGLPLPAARTQRYQGTKWIDLRHDVQSAFHYWHSGRLSLRGLIATWRGPKTFAILSWRDPLPFLFDVGRAIGMAGRLILRRRSRG